MPTSQVTSSSEKTQQKNLIPVLICLALAILTVITFWQLKDCGFINLDDNVYVYENAYVQSGLNWKSIIKAFSSELVEKSGNWHPVTWLSLMLDYQIFGLNPFGYHLINLLFHVMNTILLFLILRRMTKTLWPSAFVAALFAIHPLHVESVAWIAERKDVLSTFFWMLTMGAYSYYVEYPGLRRYFFVLLFFVLGLMAKPMLVTLPFVLLLLDYWPLHRFQETKPDYKIQTEVFNFVPFNEQEEKSEKNNMVKETLEVKKPADPAYKWSLIYPLLWEKVPLFALAILSSIVTYIAQQKGGAVSSIETLPSVVRIGNAFVSYIAYIGKMIWPSNLAVLYPHPMLLVFWQVLGSIFLLIAITLVVIWKAKKSPYLATGWLWYLGTLVPVIGIVQVGSQAMADRYTYISLIGLFITVAWGVPDLLKKWHFRKEILFTLSILIILCLSIKTWTQVGYWQDSITLFDHTLKVTDNNSFIYTNRGNSYSRLSNYIQAIHDYSNAIDIQPDDVNAYYNRGCAYTSLGNYRQAIEDLNRAIDIKPDYAYAYNGRGAAYNGFGNYKQAIEDYGRAIEIKPGYAEAYYNRGTAYNSIGNDRQAIEDYNRAIGIKPDYTMAYNNRGVSYSKLGQYQLAIEDFNKVMRLKPDSADAYYNRGNAYVVLGQYQLAIEDFNKVIRLKPDYTDAYYNRGNAYVAFGQKQLAIEDFNKVIRLKPDYTDAYYNRGNAYVAFGQKQLAIEDFNKVIRLKPDYADAYYNRGNAYAKLGRYQLAIENYSKTLHLKPDYADAYYNRGTIYYNLGQKQLAIGDFNKVIHLKPDYANAYYQRGVAYKNMEQNQSAIENFTTAIRLQPANVLAYFNRGTVYNILNQDKQAIDDYNEAIRLNPGYVDAYNSRGITYNKLGEYQLAIKDFNESIKLQSNNAIAYNNRGIAHFKHGDNDLCCSDMQKACSMGFCKGLELFKSRGYCH
jgi:protein O-mannosyl-transferase